VLREAPEVGLSGAEIDAVLDPGNYLGAAGPLVDRALARRPPS